jgi:flavin reductase (DIM6/NTAB) family NADH-FMN oxidoreductase RutF
LDIEMNSASIDNSLFAVLGKVPSGIYILTARHGDHETGMLASWVMQAGFQPPMVTVAVKQDRYLADWLAEGTLFGLNVVDVAGKQLLGHFGRGFEAGEPAFEGLEVVSGEEGVPLLTEGVLGQLICRPSGHIDSGDHRIFTAEVIAANSRSDQSPMVHVRKSGAGY